jgi:large subunit ribosomal protein L6
MSRIGKKPVPIPAQATLTVDGSTVRVKGPKGELSWPLPPHVHVAVSDGVAQVSVDDPGEREQRARWGLARVLIANMVKGVADGFEKRLEIHGVGYRAELSGRNLVLQLGYSHPVPFTPPTGINLAVEKNVIVVTGADKQAVGEAAATIRRFRKPEPYKGKGIRYVGEQVRRKAGKVVKAAGAGTK